MSWTDKQDANLRKWFGAGLSAGQIAEIMGISRNMVCGRKFRLGLCKEGTRPRFYSEDDLATLVSMKHSRVRLKKIAKTLKRTEAAICVKASKMGLSRYRSVQT